MTGRRYSIMLSSAGKDLAEHRKQVREAILAAGMFPVAMENDADVALPQDLIDASLAKVDEADGYIGLIGYRYGQVSPCPERNPGNLSLTELEFRRARQRNIPICMLIMHDDHPVPRSAVRDEPDAEGKLTAFIKLAKEGRIYAEFKSLDDVKVKATATLARLRKWLAENAKTKSKKGSGFVGDGAADPEPGIPAPPAFYAKPTFIGKSHFFGRLRELGWLDEWAATPGEPVLIFEAIGGMGKSMLTWEWVQEEARKQPGEWPGIFWYSFYERGATMHDFCVTTLAYMTGQPLADFRARPTSALGDELLRQLTARRWLLALDGIERILVAYHRLDAAQADDGDVAHDPDSANRPYEDCIRPTDSDLLQKLCGAAPSKLVMSSRLMPTALRGIGARPRDGVRHRLLIGLAPEDAERLMRDIGVRGDSARMRHFLDKEFGCHPLVVAVIAGVVYDFAPSPCDFDGWLDHPDGGANVNLASPDIKQRRNHILKSAFDALDADAREVVARLAMCAHALDWQTLQALNPRRPAPPEEVPEPKRGDDQWDFEIFQLEQQLSSAESRKEKAALEAQLQARREKTEAEYQEARRRHAAYQAALTAWQRSPKYRAANEWLRRLPPELERRGLLQWDRDANLFDLHPVIRHFAVDSTSAAARAETGQVLADFFASRPAPPTKPPPRSPISIPGSRSSAPSASLARSRRQSAHGAADYA
jgi:hypothetical protein